MKAATQIAMPAECTAAKGDRVSFEIDTPLLGIQRYCGRVSAIISDTHARVEVEIEDAFAVAVPLADLTVLRSIENADVIRDARST